MAGDTQENEGFVSRFTVLGDAIPELWIVFAVKFLGIAAYALMNSTLKLWLSSNLGYSDKEALGLVATWSILMTVFTVLVGSLTDAIGLRRAFLLGVWVCVFARLVMTFATSPWLALGAGLFPLALGEALGTPVLVAAIRRYSTTAQRSISFSLFYVLMNLGFLVAFNVFDFVRKGLGEYGYLTVPLIGVRITTYQTLFLVSLLIELCIVPILHFGIRNGVEATDEGVKITPEQPKYPRESIWNAMRLTMRDTLRETVRLFATLGRQPGFFRLLSFLMFIAFVKLIYMQMSYVYPEFGIRELGEGAPVGRLYSLNSLLIIVFVPVVGAATQRRSAYSMVTLGCAVSAASVFIMALPPAWFQGIADTAVIRWLGYYGLGLTGAINPWYVSILFFVVLLSVGEMLYSPRVYEYSAAIAPKGQEASYGALSYVPFFLAKLIVGTVSGALLAAYCPAVGPRHSETMWLVIAMIATIAPVGLFTLGRWIRVPEAGRQE